MSTIDRGQIFDYDFGPQSDSRQEGKRPALVVQTNHLNHLPNYGLTVLVPLTTKGRQSPSHVRIAPTAENGLSEVSFAKCEQIFTVPTDTLGGLRGIAARETMFAVNEALRIVLSL